MRLPATCLHEASDSFFSNRQHGLAACYTQTTKLRTKPSSGTQSPVGLSRLLASFGWDQHSHNKCRHHIQGRGETCFWKSRIHIEALASTILLVQAPTRPRTSVSGYGSRAQEGSVSPKRSNRVTQLPSSRFWYPRPPALYATNPALRRSASYIAAQCSRAAAAFL